MTDPFITVTCSDAGHERRGLPEEVVVARYARNGRRVWLLLDGEGAWGGRWDHARDGQLLRGDQPAAPGDTSNDLRTRHRLACDCGDTVEARDEKLMPCFEGFWRAGVSAVSLRLLAASLSR